jgi:very-short-patch-repair endonuclease
MRDDRQVSGARAKVSRKSMNNAEVMLWSRLRREQVHGLRFRRQHPIGPFNADFACWEIRLIIEVDGGSHMTDAAHLRDKNRTEYLQQAGWEVMRVWNPDIYSNISGVIDTISQRAWDLLQTYNLRPCHAAVLTEKQTASALLLNTATASANTPSDPSRYLPRGTGEERNLL